jgi:hypothetical protein
VGKPEQQSLPRQKLTKVFSYATMAIRDGSSCVQYLMLMVLGCQERIVVDVGRRNEEVGKKKWERRSRNSLHQLRQQPFDRTRFICQ